MLKKWHFKFSCFLYIGNPFMQVQYLRTSHLVPEFTILSLYCTRLGAYIANRYFVIPDWWVSGEFLFSRNHMAYQLKLPFVAKGLISLEKYGTEFFKHIRNEVGFTAYLPPSPDAKTKGGRGQKASRGHRPRWPSRQDESRSDRPSAFQLPTDVFRDFPQL